MCLKIKFTKYVFSLEVQVLSCLLPKGVPTLIVNEQQLSLHFSRTLLHYKLSELNPLASVFCLQISVSIYIYVLNMIGLYIINYFVCFLCGSEMS